MQSVVGHDLQTKKHKEVDLRQQKYRWLLSTRDENS